jgi:hypothetical protein
MRAHAEEAFQHVLANLDLPVTKEAQTFFFSIGDLINKSLPASK